MLWLVFFFKKIENPSSHSLLWGMGRQVLGTSVYLIEMEPVTILTALCYA